MTSSTVISDNSTFSPTNGSLEVILNICTGESCVYYVVEAKVISALKFSVLISRSLTRNCFSSRNPEDIVSEGLRALW